jgi:hypothetical protein
MVVDEFNQIYERKGADIAALLALNPSKLIPVILARLSDRYQELFRRKFENLQSWCRTFELQVPAPRAALEIPRLDTSMAYLEHAGATDVTFSMKQTYLLQHFVDQSIAAQALDPAEIESVQNCTKAVILTLRATGSRTLCGYERAAATLAGALFLEKLEELKVIDSIDERASVRMMIEMGISRRDQHGLQRVVTILADAGARQPPEAVAKRQARDAIRNVAALLSQIDYQQAAKLLKLSQVFLRALRMYAREGEGFRILWTGVVGGSISLRGDNGELVEINLLTLGFPICFFWFQNNIPIVENELIGHRIMIFKTVSISPRESFDLKPAAIGRYF